MKRLIWIAALPVLLAAAWAGRATPQIRDYVQQQEWLASSAAGDSASYGGVTWRTGAALVLTGSDAAMPPGRKAVLAGMQADAAEPVYQLTGCRVAIEDASGRLWPAEADATDMIHDLWPDRDLAGPCDGAGFSTPEDRPVDIDALFLIAMDAPAPYRLRLSTSDGRPRFLTMPLVLAP